MFLSRLPVSEYLVRSLGIEIFLNRGFKVKFIDLSCAIDGSCEDGFSADKNIFDKIEVVGLTSISQLSRAIGDCSTKSIFIDMCAGLDFGPKLHSFMRILRKLRVNYYVISDGAIPGNRKKLAPTLVARVKKAVDNPFLIFDFAFRFLARKLSRRGYFYARPSRLFLSGDFNESFISSLKEIQVTPINSRDFDIYKEYLEANSQKDVENPPFAVFLDQGVDYHPDDSILDLKPIDGEKYLSEINEFFSFFEARTGLKVVIAVHPKSRFTKSDNPFQGRSVHFNETVQVISQSSAVIAHSSTAIGLGICFGKPLYLILTAEMKRRQDLEIPVGAFADELCIPIMEFSSGSDFELAPSTPILPNYERFVHKYMSAIDGNLLNRWEIVANFIENDLQQMDKFYLHGKST